jgi:hypothetical protein
LTIKETKECIAKPQSQIQEILLTNHHLEAAFEQTKPFLSSKEKERFERSFKDFQQGRTEQVGSRVTLA